MIFPRAFYFPSSRRLLPVLASLIFPFGLQAEESEEVTKLFVREVPLTVHGKTVTMTAIEQEDGTHGYYPDKSEGMHVEVVNQLKVPTSIHWHGLILPNPMDGVPFLTQNPIEPGESQRYDFPLQQSGTYWMHSHYALQEQYLTSAPLIIGDKSQDTLADREYTVMLSDFSFTPAAEILENLRRGTMPASGTKDAAMSEQSPEPQTLLTQGWDDRSQRFLKTTVEAPLKRPDVIYDALLANRRTIDDPEILEVQPGETVLLRLIGASCATNFFINTGLLGAELLAVDGQAIKPLRGNYFQMSVAQRLDLRVTIPQRGGAFPIIAQAEGSTLICGVVLKTPEAKVPTIPVQAKTATGILDNTQERRLRAPLSLSQRAVDRTLPMVLGGKMKGYVWTINGKAYPNRDSQNVKYGERVEVVYTNTTKMGHPMHLHGLDFQVTEIDGEKIEGAMRDTLLVPAGANMKMEFDAIYPGVWAFHCHIPYHSASGMFTVLKYEESKGKFWRPEMVPLENLGLLPSPSATSED